MPALLVPLDGAVMVSPPGASGYRVESLGVIPLPARGDTTWWTCGRHHQRALFLRWPPAAGSSWAAPPRLSVPAGPRAAATIAGSTARLLSVWMRTGVAPLSDAQRILERLAREPLAPPGDSPSAGERALEALRLRLEAALTLPPSLTRATEGLGLHPVYLARVFRRRFGCSLGSYVHRRRIDQAVVAIAQHPRRSLSALASDLGFADQSHLTRVFRRHVDCTPAALARLVESMGKQDASRRSSRPSPAPCRQFRILQDTPSQSH